MFHGKYRGALKMPNEDTKSNRRFPVFLYFDDKLHQVSMKLESKASNFVSLLETLKTDRKIH